MPSTKCKFLVPFAEKHPDYDAASAVFYCALQILCFTLLIGFSSHPLLVNGPKNIEFAIVREKHSFSELEILFFMLSGKSHPLLTVALIYEWLLTCYSGFKSYFLITFRIVSVLPFCIR